MFVLSIWYQSIGYILVTNSRIEFIFHLCYGKFFLYCSFILLLPFPPFFLSSSHFVFIFFERSYLDLKKKKKSLSYLFVVINPCQFELEAYLELILSFICHFIFSSNMSVYFLGVISTLLCHLLTLLSFSSFDSER